MTVGGASELKNRVTALFEKHRSAPGTAFDPEHFLDFLLAEPREERTVYNSFSGLRRFNAFIDAVQLECAVCFSQKDREANYSLPEFIDRIEQLQRSPQGSLASLGNQVKGGLDVNFLIVANLILLAILVAVRYSLFGIGSVGLLAIAFNVWYFRFYSRDRKYQTKLRRRILSFHEIVE